MKKYGCLFLALAMFLGLAMQAQATSYDPTNLNQPRNALRMNQGAQGDALIGEWYRATVGTNFQGELDNANFLTYVSIENTSSDWVAAHVRLRTGRYSIEAIDFPILLSPKDVFWFQFEGVGTQATGLTGVKIWSADTKTVIASGLSTTGVWENNLSNSILNAFTKLPAAQKGAQELAIGYIEVIGLWKLRFVDTLDVPIPEDALEGVTFQELQAAFYNGGAPNGFYRLEPNFTTGASRQIVAVDLGNVLTGQVYMGDFTNGLYTGYQMTALADFRTNCPAPFHRDEFIRGRVLGLGAQRGAIIYNPLSFNNSSRIDPAYTDPDWATNFGPTWNDGDDLDGVAQTSAVSSFSLDEVDDALAKQKVAAAYFNGGFREERTTFTMATITFPTKYLHFFFTYPGSGTNVHAWPVGQPGPAANVRGLIDVAATVGNVTLFGGIYGLDEEQPYSVPSPYLLTNLKWEVNCVPIGALSRAKLTEFCFLTHDNGPLDVDGSFYAGWFEMMGFGLMAGATNDDPRNRAPFATNDVPAQTVSGYDRTLQPLLNCLLPANNLDSVAFGYNKLIPAMVQILDFEFANFLHARSFVPAFDNPNNCPVNAQRVLPDACANGTPNGSNRGAGGLPYNVRF